MDCQRSAMEKVWDPSCDATFYKIDGSIRPIILDMARSRRRRSESDSGKNLASDLIYFTVRVPSQLASSGAADFFLTVYCKMVCLPRNLMNDSVYHSFD
jgi:hypothetical protein